ncbi:hypothetical protein COU20_01660, partial [Candidatus Kaiserbacteria bacterium CG10_big_fil_rev_8_21_14_0_10_59_10]
MQRSPSASAPRRHWHILLLLGALACAFALASVAPYVISSYTGANVGTYTVFADSGGGDGGGDGGCCGDSGGGFGDDG